MQLRVQASNRNSDHQFPGLWDWRRTVLNAGLQSAKSRPHRKLKMEMSLYSRSTTVIHHDSPWLIRHDTWSVRVRNLRHKLYARQWSLWWIRGLRLSVDRESLRTYGQKRRPCFNHFLIDGQIVHSDAIWNDMLELQRQFRKQGIACNLTLFETTRIPSETILKTMSLKHALWRYLKRFGTAVNFYKQFLKSMRSQGIWNDLKLQRIFLKTMSSLNVFFTIYTSDNQFKLQHINSW